MQQQAQVGTAVPQLQSNYLGGYVMADLPIIQDNKHEIQTVRRNILVFKGHMDQRKHLQVTHYISNTQVN